MNGEHQNTPAIDYIVSVSIRYELYMFIKACKY